ncbi:MAG: DoxX family protein [Candidatus Binatia bacterium]
MTKRSPGHQLIAQLLRRLRDLDWIPILLVRLSVGLLFFESGRGKLFFTLEELGKYFVELGIPLPHLNAIVVASIEFFGGMCLILGLATRVFSIQLAIIMLVATLTAEIKTVHTVGDFLYLPTVLLFVIFIWLAFSGPGKVSIDYLIARTLGFDREKA